MQKIVVLLVLLLSSLFVVRGNVFAQVNCNNWVCDNYSCDGNGCSSECSCGDALGGGTAACPSGTYACNSDGNYGICCPVGSSSCECGVNNNGNCRPCDPVLSVYGKVTSVSCTSIKGWVCGGYRNAPDYVAVLKLANGPNNTSIPIVASDRAVEPSTETGGVCNGTQNHGFTITIPASLKDGAPHTLWISGHDTDSTNFGGSLISGGAPAATITCTTCTNTAPTNLSVTSISPTSANITWTLGTGGTSQRLYVDEDLAEVNANCPTANDCVTNVTGLTTSTNQYTVTGMLPSTTYYFRVVTYASASCSSSTVVTYTTIAQPDLAGTVYLDANNTCGGSAWTGGGVSMSLDGGAGVAIAGDGTYTIDTTTGAHTLSVSIPAGYICSTGAGCGSCTNRSVNTSTPSNNNFYLTTSREAWWQVVGAPIYAGSLGGGTTIRSELPYSTTALIMAGPSGTSGALLRSSGSTDLGSGVVSDDLWSTLARYRGKKMDYAYFAAHMGVIKNQASDWPNTDTINLGSYPNGADFGYMDPPSGTANVSSPITVTSPNKYVVFVDGDLEINSNVQVDNGGFLAFIVSGDIIIDPSVTEIDGIYLSTGDFVSETVDPTGTVDDVALDVTGTVVAWGTFSLERDLGDNNTVGPAEQFTYSPQLILDMPEKMKVFAMQWREVEAGTLGN